MKKPENRKIRKQSWRGNPPPSTSQHRECLIEFENRGVLVNVMWICTISGVYARGRKSREKGTSTCPSLYLFSSKRAFCNNGQWIACIDALGSIIRMLIRPIPLNVGSYDIIPANMVEGWRVSVDNNRWKEKTLRTSEDLADALKLLDALKSNYEHLAE